MLQQLTISKAPRLVLREVKSQGPMLAAMVIRIAAAAATFAATFIVARAYGAVVTGEYALFTQTVLTLAMFAIFGNDKLVVRRIAGNLADERRDLARLSYTHALKQVAMAALGLAVLLVAASPWADFIGISAALIPICAFSVVLYALMQMTATALRGAHQLVQSQALLALQPAMCLVLTVAVIYLWKGPPAVGLALSYGVAALMTTMLAFFLVRRLMNGWPRAQQKHPDDGRTNSLIFGLTIGIDVATGWLVLSLTAVLLSLADAGIFRVCLQFMLAVWMVVTTYEGMISPQLASLFRSGDLDGARRTLNRSIAFLLLVAGTPLLVIGIFAEPLLGLMGDEFREGATALRILAVGQIATLASGGAGALISMSGHEAYSLKLAIISFVVVIAAMVLLTPYFGIDGGACALALMYAIRNLGSLVYARRILAAKQRSQA